MDSEIYRVLNVDTRPKVNANTKSVNNQTYDTSSKKGANKVARRVRELKEKLNSGNLSDFEKMKTYSSLNDSYKKLSKMALKINPNATVTTTGTVSANDLEKILGVTLFER